MADPEAARRLVEAHDEYARRLARRIHQKLGPSIEYDDVLGLARIGLFQAAERFDPTANAAFTTFAYRRIQGAVMDGLEDLLPPESIRPVRRLASANDFLEATLSSGADPAAALSRAISGLGTLYLLDRATDANGAEPVPVDSGTPDQRAAQAELLGRLPAALAALTDRQRTIIALHYERDLSLSKIALRLGVNKATVSRDHAKALESLRDRLTEEPKAAASVREETAS